MLYGGRIMVGLLPEEMDENRRQKYFLLETLDGRKENAPD